jgi:hypothetical protein
MSMSSPASILGQQLNLHSFRRNKKNNNNRSQQNPKEKKPTELSKYFSKIVFSQRKSLGDTGWLKVEKLQIEIWGLYLPAIPTSPASCGQRVSHSKNTHPPKLCVGEF